MADISNVQPGEMVIVIERSHFDDEAAFRKALLAVSNVEGVRVVKTEANHAKKRGGIAAG